MVLSPAGSGSQLGGPPTVPTDNQPPTSQPRHLSTAMHQTEVDAEKRIPAYALSPPIQQQQQQQQQHSQCSRSYTHHWRAYVWLAMWTHGVPLWHLLHSHCHLPSRACSRCCWGCLPLIGIIPILRHLLLTPPPGQNIQPRQLLQRPPWMRPACCCASACASERCILKGCLPLAQLHRPVCTANRGWPSHCLLAAATTP